MKVTLLFAMLIISMLSVDAFAFKEGDCMNLGTGGWRISNKIKPYWYQLQDRRGKIAAYKTIKKDAFKKARAFSPWEPGAAVRWVKTKEDVADDGFKIKVFILKEDKSCID